MTAGPKRIRQPPRPTARSGDLPLVSLQAAKDKPDREQLQDKAGPKAARPVIMVWKARGLSCDSCHLGRKHPVGIDFTAGRSLDLLVKCPDILQNSHRHACSACLDLGHGSRERRN